MEELAVSCVICLIDRQALLEVLFIFNDILEGRMAHVGFETIVNVLLGVALEVHEHRAVEVDHGRGGTHVIISLESLDRL